MKANLEVVLFNSNSSIITSSTGTGGNEGPSTDFDE